MSLGGLKTEADLKRFLEAQLQTPGVMPPIQFPITAIDSGTVELPYPGESNESETATVEHKLNAEPANVLFVSYGNAGIRFVIPEWFEPTKTTFAVHAFCPHGAPAEGEKSPLRWTAYV